MDDFEQLLKYNLMWDTLCNLVPLLLEDKSNDWSEELEELKWACPEFF